jgi:hypothetical protein
MGPGPAGDFGDDSPWDPGFFYLYDNTSPESDYVADEPCRVVCQSDPSVQCSSYAGDCSGLPDRLVCDGQTVMCPASAAQHQVVQTSPAVQPASQSDQPCAGRHEGSGQGQAKTDAPCNGKGGAATPAERCEDRRDGGRRHGQGKAAVSCNGANGTP